MIREIDILKNMEYTRTGGSKQELQCAKYIQSELRKLKLKSQIIIPTWNLFIQNRQNVFDQAQCFPRRHNKKELT